MKLNDYQKSIIIGKVLGKIDINVIMFPYNYYVLAQHFNT